MAVVCLRQVMRMGGAGRGRPFYFVNVGSNGNLRFPDDVSLSDGVYEIAPPNGHDDSGCRLMHDGNRAAHDLTRPEAKLDDSTEADLPLFGFRRHCFLDVWGTF